ncbi:glycyl-tRNA synthetase [Halovenus aranensis]|uniref:glycine--tRNA ligase n=1 Tax=Halovenus aranensis TaxID=890420 RepID=A0A1G8VM16_9EURY|nr:glycine--tRNA ligase [Halovenus aranensis]SDJ67023.1 glycyl-tRNA synthetase [Halovenus aranensis]
MSEGDRLSELAKRRGFFNQTAAAYGGVAGFYTYGPQGAALKDNIEAAWRDRYVTREGHMEIDAPTVLPEPVFEASGHVETFTDMLVECVECGESHRADHLVEDHPESTVEDAEALPNEEVGELIADHDIDCPACGTPLAEEPVEDFNLMFETNIGPGSSSPGYLRPETAQGIFVDFPQWAEYARNQLPFGVAQIGKAYRNEISPRKSIIRVREFSQAELEHFVDPDDEPPLERVEDVEIPLYSVAQQQGEGSVKEMTVREAVDEGVVDSPWLAYYLGISKEWYERIGVDMDRFRYRQHLAGELSHYASECWDAESELGGDWVELTGFATRGTYDLDKHAEYTGEDFSVFQQYDEPVTVERPTVDPEMSYLGPEFGNAAADIVAELEALAERDPDAFDAEAVTVELDGETYEIPTEKTGFAVEEVTESGEHVTPHIIEPSFGVGRLIYTALAHSYREDEIDGDQRTRLALPPEVAPTTVGVFPLMDKDGLGERARKLASELRAAGLEVTYDDSGAIGRRYRRQDEVGTPFCVTVDYDTLEAETVTVRERDSTDQVRVPIAELPATLSGLRDGDITFDDI